MAFPAIGSTVSGKLAARPGQKRGGGTVEVLMKRTGWRPRWAALAAASLAAAAVCAPVTAAGAATSPGPEVKLIAAQNSITVPRYGHQVFLDPGIWVASLGSALELDVQRPDYATPMSVTQVVHLPGGGTQRIPWPASVVATMPDGPEGLRPDLTVANSHGKVVASSRLEFCPDSYDPERASSQQSRPPRRTRGVLRRSVPEVAGLGHSAGLGCRSGRAGLPAHEACSRALHRHRDHHAHVRAAAEHLARRRLRRRSG